MRNLLTLFTVLVAGLSLFGQNYPLVTIKQINTPIDLANCNDTTIYLGDTVRFRAYVVHDGGLSEVASGSVQGGNRPFVHMIDTASNGVSDSLNSIEVMGIYEDANGNLLPIPGFTTLLAGDKVEVTGVVGQFDGNTQFNTIAANSVVILGTGPSTITPAVVSVGDLNDNNRVNNVQTGEYWQNTYVRLQNVTVVQVNPFSGNRVSFDVQDANGNIINVSDRFLAQKTPSFQTTNPNSPSTTGTGSFVPPAVGTLYASIEGIVRHSANGCTGGSGRGYEINPFDSTHYVVGASAPSITNLINLPLTPTSSDPVTVSANISDADGTLDTVEIYWSADPALPSGSFPAFNMTDLGNGTYEYTIPAQANGSLVRYYVRAVDNDGSAVFSPVSPAGASNPNFKHYTVRDNGLKIFDLQFSGDGTGESAFVGQTVTVSGVVTAARRDCDLEYVYLQDPDDDTYAGIALIPNQDLSNVYRDQWLEVTGTVQETFGVTYLNVSSYNALPLSQTITPTPVNPSDPNLDLEAYEGMLISYQDPTGGQLEVSNADLGFGEYAVAVAGSSTEKRVLAGRQDGTRANSSLYVSLVSDTSYNTNDGMMMVPPIAAATGMTMDAMEGILWFSFGSFKILPRNNFDIVNLSVSLDTNNCNVPTNIGLVEADKRELVVFPNPAQEVLNLRWNGQDQSQALLFDLNGRQVAALDLKEGINRLTINELPQGVYVLQVRSPQGQLLGTEKVAIRK